MFKGFPATGIQGHWFWGEVLKQKNDYRWAAIAALLANLFAFLVSLFAMVVYDRVLPNSAKESLVSLLFGASLVLCIDYLVRQSRGFLIDRAGHFIDLALNQKIFDSFVLRWGVTQGSSAGANAAIVRELDSIREFFASATITTFVDIPFSLLFLVVILFVSGPLAVIPLVTIIAMLIVGSLAHKRNSPAAKESVQLSRTKNALVVECLSSREYIGTLPDKSYFSDRWSEAIERYAVQSDRTRWISNTSTNLVNLLTQATQVAVISAGVLLESMTGVLVATTIMAGRAIAPFSQVVSLLSRFSQAEQSYKAIGQLLHNPMINQDSTAARTSPMVLAGSLPGAIEFRSVSATYDSKKTAMVLQSVSFKLEAGDRLAIVGRTGSGKTSLLRALLGQTDIFEGEILFGGVRLEDIDRASLMNRCSFVLQENYLYKASILENISLSSADMPAERLTQVLQRTRLEALITALPDGLRTDIGERGERLSGGQRRLLALTRALYRPHTHLMLDEPTSGLDPQTELTLVQHLFTEDRTTTVVYTTHRPAPLAWATKVLVLDSGRVIDFGPRDDVLRRLRS